ncbi:hypothetical protein BHM03_00005859, partial [Ensete ventricosum]
TTLPSALLLEAISKTKTLLNSIFGEVGEGDIFVVLRTNDSGKPTLINALANCIVWERLQGPVTLNGKKLDGWLLNVISAYVMQDDLMHPMLIMEETLMFVVEFWLSLSRKLNLREVKYATIKTNYQKSTMIEGRFEIYHSEEWT